MSSMKRNTGDGSLRLTDFFCQGLPCKRFWGFESLFDFIFTQKRSTDGNLYLTLRDIFALAKVILRLWRSDIIFASSTAARQYHSAKPNITAKQYNSPQGEYNKKTIAKAIVK